MPGLRKVFPSNRRVAGEPHESLIRGSDWLNSYPNGAAWSHHEWLLIKLALPLNNHGVLVIVLVDPVVLDDLDFVRVGVDLAPIRNEVFLIEFNYFLLELLNIVLLEQIFAVDLAGVVVGNKVAIAVLDIEHDPLVLQEWLMHFDELLTRVVEGSQKALFGLGLVYILRSLYSFVLLIFLENTQTSTLSIVFAMLFPQ